MKTKLLFLLTLTCMSFIGFAQKPLEFSIVIRQDSLSASDLYESTKSWFAETYANNKAVIRDDNPGKQITGKGSIPFKASTIYTSISGYIEYLIDTQFREGRLKLTMRNFTHTAARKAMYDNDMGLLVDSLPSDLKDIGISGANRKTSYKYYFKHGKPLCEETFVEIAESLKSFLKKREADTKEDW